ncbi:MAG TPA: hypothetical protein VNM72_12585 [Blastocatellia bacterium]|nr:hypothetical protein [Blastocatellia bacterium]
MGRTVLPYSAVLEAEYGRWKNFRRALRREDQQLLDDLFELARRHVQAGANSSMPIAFHPILMSMLLELLRLIRRLELKLAYLETLSHAPGD